MTSEGSPRREKIGVMGGTFDPIHYGHLFAAETAQKDLDLDRVIFVPSGNPPHKSYKSMAGAEDRYAMAAMAIKGHPRFEISRIETDRAGASYTADTLEELSKKHPGGEFFLIAGLDAALDIPNWYEPEKILSLCSVIVIARTGYIRDKIEELDDAIRYSLIVSDDAPMDIAATDIRHRLRSRESIGNMAPDVVCDYIREKRLYSGTED
jgi:nicotinate-nucleotide adenylyltransferase